VADLSPGLENALGLTADKECTVDVPTPAGAQMPPAGKPADSALVPLTFDSADFPQDTTRTLVALTVTDKATFSVVNVVGQEDGGQSVLRHAGNKIDVLFSATTVFPIPRDHDQIPSDVADELNKAEPQEVAQPTGPAGSPPQTAADVTAKMFAAAQQFVGHVTSNVPGTDGGNLACAWAVNEVTRLALGRPISSVDGSNGLSTYSIFEALQKHHTRLASAADAQPGTIIIAPTQGANHGHVGIVGAASGGNVLVYSNKSVPGVFAQNFTVASFTNHYTRRGLDVLFYALNRNQFV